MSLEICPVFLYSSLSRDISVWAKFEAGFLRFSWTNKLIAEFDTGTRSVAMVFRAVVFTFVPTAVELVLVCALLGRIFQPVIAIMVVATFAAYVLWTAQLTKAAAKVCFLNS